MSAIQTVEITAKTEKISFRIRWMVSRDMARVSEIDEESFNTPMSVNDIYNFRLPRNTIALVAYHLSEADTTQLLRLLKKEESLNNRGLPDEAIAVRRTIDEISSKEIIFGCVFYEVNPDSIIIRSFAVAKKYRGKGVGKALLARMIEKTKRTNKEPKELFTEIREGKSDFFVRHGFVGDGTRLKLVQS